jgi:hypothetical protein
MKLFCQKHFEYYSDTLFKKNRALHIFIFLMNEKFIINVSISTKNYMPKKEEKNGSWYIGKTVLIFDRKEGCLQCILKWRGNNPVKSKDNASCSIKGK